MHFYSKNFVLKMWACIIFEHYHSWHLQSSPKSVSVDEILFGNMQYVV